MADLVGRRVRTVAALLVLAELVVYVGVISWIGLGWTLLATLATTAIGWALLARQGTRALADLRERARAGQAPGRELGDAGLVAAGGLLMILPGFLGDLVGLLCLLPPTRPLLRALLGRLFVSRLPVHLRGPVQVRSARVAGVRPGPTAAGDRPMVIEGEVVRDDPAPGAPPAR